MCQGEITPHNPAIGGQIAAAESDEKTTNCAGRTIMDYPFPDLAVGSFLGAVES